MNKKNLVQNILEIEKNGFVNKWKPEKLIIISEIVNVKVVAGTLHI